MNDVLNLIDNKKLIHTYHIRQQLIRDFDIPKSTNVVYAHPHSCGICSKMWVYLLNCVCKNKAYLCEKHNSFKMCKSCFISELSKLKNPKIIFRDINEAGNKENVCSEKK